MISVAIRAEVQASAIPHQTSIAFAYIKDHAKSAKPFFMDINFIKMHNPTNAAPAFRGRSHLGDYSDSLMEMDDDIGKIMDTIRAEAPDTIVILTVRICSILITQFPCSRNRSKRCISAVAVVSRGSNPRTKGACGVVRPLDSSSGCKSTFSPNR
jgi:hypothetical protein